MGIIILLSVTFFFTFTTINSISTLCFDNTNCLCSTNGNEIIYSCNKTKDKAFFVNIIPMDSVQINCLNWQNWQEYDLSTITVGKEMNTVNFQHCGLMNELSLKDVITNLGLEQTNELIFNSYKNYYGKLEKEDLRGFYNVKKLDLSYNGLTNISPTLFDNFLNLKSLNLSHNELRLPYTVFEKCKFLEILDLSFNNLTKIFHELFSTLYYLKYLDLSCNHLVDFVSGTFDNLKNVTFLNMSHNDIMYFTDEMFSSLHSLEILDISFNQLIVIQPNLLKHNAMLIEVYLHDNKKAIGTLPQDFLADLTKLRVVCLNNNKYQFLPDNLFENSTALKYINLSYNNLPTLPKNIFNGLRNLENLVLNDNRFETLPYQILKDLINLEKLDLSGNKMTHITRDLFDNVPFLLELNMERNEISQIDANAFDNLLILEIAKFSYNKLTFDKYNNWYSLRNNLFLESFHLSHNNIESLFSAWTKNGEFLRLLDLSYNQIKIVKTDELIFPTNKSEIDLTFNKIEHICFKKQLPDYVKNNEIVVHLNHNPITCDSYLYEFLRFRVNRMPNVQSHCFHFLLGNLSCTNTDESVRTRMKYLKLSNDICHEDSYIKISKSCLSNCECSVRLDEDNNRILDCSYRNLTKFFVDPKKMKLLRGYNLIVNLTGNFLTETPSLHELEDINVIGLLLSNNNISKMNAKILPLSLKILEFHNNNITLITLNDFNSVATKKWKHFTLSGNPLICNCHVSWASSLFQFLRYKHSDINGLTCQGISMSKVKC